MLVCVAVMLPIGCCWFTFWLLLACWWFGVMLLCFCLLWFSGCLIVLLFTLHNIACVGGLVVSICCYLCYCLLC